MKTIEVKIDSININEIIDKTVASHKPIRLKVKNKSTILISENYWRSIQETIYLLSIHGMRESIIEGKNTPISECSDKLER